MPIDHQQSIKHSNTHSTDSSSSLPSDQFEDQIITPYASNSLLTHTTPHKQFDPPPSYSHHDQQKHLHPPQYDPKSKASQSLPFKLPKGIDLTPEQQHQLFESLSQQVKSMYLNSHGDSSSPSSVNHNVNIIHNSYTYHNHPSATHSNSLPITSTNEPTNTTTTGTGTGTATTTSSLGGDKNNTSAHSFKSTTSKHQPDAQFLSSETTSMLNNPYYCRICGVACTGKETYEAHLRGKKHIKVQRNAHFMEKLWKGNNVPTSSSYSFTPSADSSDSTFTNTTSSTADSYSSETSGDKIYYCKLCSIQCTSPENYASHLEGKKHLRLKKQEDMEKELQEDMKKLKRDDRSLDLLMKQKLPFDKRHVLNVLYFAFKKLFNKEPSFEEITKGQTHNPIFLCSLEIPERVCSYTSKTVLDKQRHISSYGKTKKDAKKLISIIALTRLKGWGLLNPDVVPEKFLN